MPWNVVGQQQVTEAFARGLRDGTLSHAYLLVGPTGVGKRALATEMAAALNCRDSDKPCHACSSCRRILAEKHPDVHVVEASRDERGGDEYVHREIRIEQIRELQHQAALSPFEGRHRVFIVDGADRLRLEAANCLLKTLEEPPEATTLILVSAAPHVLLPTVRSRCLKLTFAPLPLELVATRVQELRQVDAATARLCAALADGSLAGALALDPAALARRQELVQRLEALVPGEARGALLFAQDFAADRASAEVHLDLVRTWYRDVAALGSGAPESALVNLDLAEQARASAGRLSPAQALLRLDLVAAARARLKLNASPRLQLEQLLLRFLFPDA